jgi:hypothetical protein
MVVTPSGLGGNDAANAESAREHVAHKIFNVSIVAITRRNAV